MKRGQKWMFGFLVLVLATLLAVAPVAAQNLSFRVDELISNVYINDDGSIYIDYQITFSPSTSSDPIDIVDIGLPNANYRLSDMKADINGVNISDIRHSEFVHPGIEIHLGKQTIQPGTTATLHVLALVRDMVFQDTSDPDYASMEFSPFWYGSESVIGNTHLEIIIHFPEGVTSEEARYHQEPFTDSAIVDNRVTYAYIYPDARLTGPHMVGVSFPKKYLKEGIDLVVTPPPTSPPSGGTTGGAGGLVASLCGSPFCFLLVAILFIVGLIFVGVRASFGKMKYLPPSLAVEGVGVKRGLTAVEAAILLEAPLDKILTMILFGLLKKRAVTVLSEDPLKIEVNQPVPEDLRPYEKQFIGAISEQKLNEKELRKLMIDLIKSVNEKMKGFSRKDSVAYYKDLVSRAWEQVESADSPEVKSQRLDEGLEWTVLDDDWSKKVQGTFGDQPVPLPSWWWYYRPWVARVPTQPASTGGTGGGVSVPRPAMARGEGSAPTMPTLPGSAFAGTIVSGFQDVAGKVVSSVERFTGSVASITNPPPPPPRSSGRWSGGGGRSGGCACACACAGCACACAGGGR